MKAYLLLYESGRREVVCCKHDTRGTPKLGEYDTDTAGYSVVTWWRLEAYLNGTGNARLACDDLTGDIEDYED